MRRFVPETAYARPVTVLMVFVALLVLGALAWVRIPVQLMPEGFEPHFLWVQVPFPNASPRETDELVVRPIAEQLSTIRGLERLGSRARASSAGFSLEFHASISMDEAYNEVVDRLERTLPDLPDDVENYWVYKFDPNDEPILWAGVTFPDEVDDPFHLVDKVVIPHLRRVSGVASVDVWGVDGRGIFIDYDRDQMMANSVDIGSVQRRLGADNFQMSGGRIQDRGQVLLVRSLARLTDIEELRTYPIDAEGRVLDDIADVSFRGLASASIDRINGREAAAFGVKKESSANTVEVAAAVAAAMEELEADPRAQGAEFLVFFDQGEIIEESNRTLLDSAALGGLLSVVILYLFLREWRMTVLISLSIPFSLLITVAVLYFRGESLNLIAMMGLMLAVGMVVDNAIVVIESIYQRRALGTDLQEAAIAGTAEVNLAILASTATTMVVFLPVILMTEDADAAFFLRVLGLPVVFALGASVLVALVFAPLATRYIRVGQILDDPPWLRWLSDRYERLLDLTLLHRADASLTLLAMGALTVMVAIPGVQCNPSGDGGMNDVNLRFEVPRDATPERRDELVRLFEGLLHEHQDAWGIDVYHASLNSTSSSGEVSIYLVDDPPLPRDEVIEQLKALLPTEIPGVTAHVGWDSGEAGGSHTGTVQIYGEEMEVLDQLAVEVVRRVQAVPGVITAASLSEDDGADELRLLPDREALLRYGVSAQTVAQTVAFSMRGTALEPLYVGEAEIDVESRLSGEDRASIGTLLDFPVFSPTTGNVVPVRALTDLEFGKGPSTIRREGRRTSTAVSIDFALTASRSEIMPEVSAALADMDLPRGYSLDANAWVADQAEEDNAIFFAMGMSVVFVYLLMGILFESWILPLSILTTIPMAMMGAMWGLYLTSTHMDTMAGIGLVVLVGVVVNNGIVLVDLITQLRDEGVARDVAIREACRRRLRPILMTALTTVCGLIPMAMGSSDFVGVPYAPLGRTVIGGLTAATLLTLIFVPYLYALLDDMRDATLRWASAALRRTP